MAVLFLVEFDISSVNTITHELLYIAWWNLELYKASNHIAQSHDMIGAIIN